MCGIFACAGPDNCTKVIIDGLKSLEYRGYDSWGTALKTGKNIELKKISGKYPKSVNLNPSKQKPESGILVGRLTVMCR